MVVRWLTSIVVCAFVAGACSRPSGRDVASDRQLLAKSLREHVDAVNASDVDAILAGMTDDVVYLPPGAPLVRRKDALRKVLEPAYKLIDAEVSMRPVETVVADDWAWEWGHLSGTTRLLAGGSPTRLDGKYFYVYRRQPDGSWKIARDIYNENAPSAALAALRE